MTRSEWLEAWPVTIWHVRYSGVYEGGKWAAICGYGVPPDAVASDGPAMSWWDYWRDHQGVAVGPTPQAAVEELIEKQGGGRRDRNGCWLDVDLPLEAFKKRDWWVS